MKKVFLTVLMLAAIATCVSKVNAQSSPIKIGVFDISVMVQQMPGYPAVDSMVQLYERDSLAAEYDFYRSEYSRLDSTYKLDSVSKKAPSVLGLEQQQRQQVALTLVYWQQYAQEKSEQKREQLAQPLIKQVYDAYQKVLAVKKYTIVLKPQSLENGTVFSTAMGGADNIFKLVAAELKVTLSRELDFPEDDQSQENNQQAPAKPQTKPAGTKPKQ
jgi:Skp family chaperone for outer membrane proteins